MTLPPSKLDLSSAEIVTFGVVGALVDLFRMTSARVPLLHETDRVKDEKSWTRRYSQSVPYI